MAFIHPCMSPHNILFHFNDQLKCSHLKTKPCGDVQWRTGSYIDTPVNKIHIDVNHNPRRAVQKKSSCVNLRSSTAKANLTFSNSLTAIWNSISTKHVLVYYTNYWFVIVRKMKMLSFLRDCLGLRKPLKSSSIP